MSIIQTLSEGIVNRDMKKEGAALLSKWGKTGLLEGLQTEHQQASMARLLENQAKELLRESSSMSANDVEGFAAVAFPIVRRVFAGLIANELVSVQPMSLPSGLIFFLDFVYSPNLGEAASQDSRLGNAKEKSIYGTDRVASQITGGVNLVDARGGNLSGPREMVGYGYASPTASLNAQCASNVDDLAVVSVFKLDGSVSDDRKKLIKYDPDLLALTSAGCVIIDVAEDHFTNADFENLAAFALTDPVEGTTSGNDLQTGLNANASLSGIAIAEVSQIRRLTQRVSSDSRGAPFQSGISGQAKAVRLVLVIDKGTDISAETDSAAVLGAALDADKLQYPQKDAVATDAVGSGPGAGALNAFTLQMEGEQDIPEIDIKVDSIAITAQSKKLKAKWTPELGQDLNAYHNLDAEVELTSILSEQIALEIDREILADLVNGATAATYYWSRSPGLFVNKVTGAELGASSAAPDFTGTVSEWYETLIETINDVSAQIHRKTLRGGANYIICSPEVANILEFTSGFRANVTADADKGSIGAVNLSLDMYMLRMYRSKLHLQSSDQKISYHVRRS